jgi:hypothetical protein
MPIEMEVQMVPVHARRFRRPIMMESKEVTQLLDGMWKKDVSMSIDEPTPREYLPLLNHPSPTKPKEDLRITHHVTQIITELAQNGGHLMSLGTSILPALVYNPLEISNSVLIIYSFLKLAGRFEFVKHGLLGLGTAHLKCLVKLTGLERLA